MALSIAETIAQKFGVPKQLSQYRPGTSTLGTGTVPTVQSPYQPGTGALGTGTLSVPSGPPATTPTWLTGDRPEQSVAPTAAPVAPQAPPVTSSSSSLVEQLSGRADLGGNRSPSGAAMGNATTTADQFAQAGGVLPQGIVPGTPQADAYMKTRLLSMGSANPQMGSAQTAMPVPTSGQPGQQQPQTLEQMLQQQMGLGGSGVSGGLPGAGQVPGIDPQLQQILMQRLTGQGGPQVDPNQQAFQIDPELLNILKQQATGQDPNMPSFQDVVSGSYEPIAAQMDKIFNTTQTQLFEDLIGRGVLQSGEATSRITQLADQLGVSKAAAFGQIALEYAQMRQDSIQSAIQQWGILEGNRASNAVTLTAANLDAAVSTQNVAMQTLTNLNTAMAQIASGERIAGAQIKSSEKIAGMDIQSRQQIAQLQASTQQTVANISAQAMLQASNMDFQVAMQGIDSRMALEGVDWQRFNDSPDYRQEIVTQMAIRQDTLLAIAQSGAAQDIMDSLQNPVP